jgi:hypothetical protein
VTNYPFYKNKFHKVNEHLLKPLIESFKCKS